MPESALIQSRDVVIQCSMYPLTFISLARYSAVLSLALMTISRLVRMLITRQLCDAKCAAG